MPDLDLAKKASADVFGKACAGCKCDLDWIHFRKESRSRDGHAALCHECESVPRLSTTEHTERLRERNFNAEAVRRQRWEYQDELKNGDARTGRPMLYSDFIGVVKKLVPQLYFTEGRIVGDLAVFLTYPGPQTRLEGRDFEYLWFIPKIVMPEYSKYEFNEATDVPIREIERGWRTPLLRLIKRGLLTQEVCDKVFGYAHGLASDRWYRTLQDYRSDPTPKKPDVETDTRF